MALVIVICAVLQGLAALVYAFHDAPGFPTG